MNELDPRLGSRSFLVVGKDVPRTDAVNYLGSSFYGVPGLDGRNRLVYRQPAMPEPPKVAPPPGVPWFPSEPDSAFIVALDLETRKLDTLGSIRLPKVSNTVVRTPDGGFSMYGNVNPMPMVDDFAVLPDGAWQVEFRKVK